MQRRARTASFDEAYYQRYYMDELTRVGSAESAASLARFVLAYLAHLDVEVSTVLEFGPGVGNLKGALLALDGSLDYEGVELSEYACEAYGWTPGSIASFTPEEPVDLVLCQGVLQYLTARDAERALRRLGKICESALYLEVLTTEDWEENVQRDLTDDACHVRPAAFYRERLARDFVACGGGLYVKRDAGVTLFELERPY